MKRGDLEAIQIGGRGQWRIERDRLEAFIHQAYEDAGRHYGSSVAITRRASDRGQRALVGTVAAVLVRMRSYISSP